MEARIFYTYLRTIAKDAVQVLAQFEQPPTFDLWRNPIVDAARLYPSLAGESRSCQTDALFRNSGGELLVDDARDLVDGGITPEKRLWLLYNYHSLTDFHGRNHYTVVTSLVSVKLIDSASVALSLGFDWLRDDTLSRIQFADSEASLREKVFQKSCWRGLHQLSFTL